MYKMGSAFSMTVCAYLTNYHKNKKMSICDKQAIFRKEDCINKKREDITYKFYI
jgi:hypothetical protein